MNLQKRTDLAVYLCHHVSVLIHASRACIWSWHGRSQVETWREHTCKNDLLLSVSGLTEWREQLSSGSIGWEFKKDPPPLHGKQAIVKLTMWKAVSDAHNFGIHCEQCEVRAGVHQLPDPGRSLLLRAQHRWLPPQCKSVLLVSYTKRQSVSESMWWRIFQIQRPPFPFYHTLHGAWLSIHTMKRNLLWFSSRVRFHRRTRIQLILRRAMRLHLCARRVDGGKIC